MQCKTQVIAQDFLAATLIRATAPRLQARYLLCGEPSLGNAVRSLAQFAEHELDARVAVFIADACGVLYALQGQHHELDDQDSCQNTSQMLVESLRDTLHDMEDWLESRAKETKPKLLRLPIQSVERWPLPMTRSTILVASQTWTGRGWILFHMCKLKILNAFINASVPGPLQGTSEQAEIDLRPSTDFLLSLLPPLIGIVDKHGQLQPLPQLHDTGLLIAQYPLWLIGATQHAPEQAKAEASSLLRFVEEQRSISAKAC